MRRRVMWRPLLAAAAAGLAVLATACGSSSNSSSDTTSGSASTGGPTKVSVGTATINVPKSKLRLGILMNSQTNKWQQNFVASATAAAKKAGYSVTVEDANFDISKRLNQIQSAATSKKYDAVVVIPIDGKQECPGLTKILPKANVLVSVAAQQACGRDVNDGEGMWAPGTLNFVGGDSSVIYFRGLLEAAAKQNPGPQTAAIITGPELSSAAASEKKAVSQFAPSHPDFKINDWVYTDFTTPTGYTKTLNYLRAHPDVTMLVSVYTPDLSRGVVNALKASGKLGKVKVVDAGGSQYSYDQIKQGNIQLTLPYFPKEQGAYPVQTIVDAQAGKNPERFVSDVPSGSGTVDDPLVITKDNLSQYTPQY
jgi:ribose transport system substrate-binding protein